MKLLILILLLLNGCAIVSTTDTLADGRKTTTTAFELGRTEALKGFKDTTNKDGREILIDSASADVNVDGLRAGIGGLGIIIGEALKTYMGGRP